MSGLFLVNHLSQPLFNLSVGCPVAQEASQIVFDHTEQAGADLAVSREADPIAMPAKRFSYGSNYSYFGAAAGKNPALCCRGDICVSNGAELETMMQPLEYFLSWNY